VGERTHSCLRGEGLAGGRSASHAVDARPSREERKLQCATAQRD
jgi:hypothetical protein